MKKVLLGLFVLAACIGLPVTAAVGAPIQGGDSVIVSLNGGTIKNAIASLDGIILPPAAATDTAWTFNLSGIRPGQRLSFRVVGVSDGSSDPSVAIQGDAVGAVLTVSKAVCRDKTNRQRAVADILNGDPTYCDCAGMTPSSGDSLVITVTCLTAGGDIPQQF
ncbi:hypothetical protein [Desulfatibacillum aliphaticivorans]|uniref:Prepilin-type cleavage/methylation-like protein n=1 Tax=Desulfatibacillum aliphaticivorans TaxID=218208 RepID=B8FE98_DESAL|nr:hypothetical protein [Desulfatibacillum aliphaticivorans]ACL06879.1 prepilin-type cleavage/methylation-like protein [Desulfatibacillum aliphaticivorans]